MGTLHCALENGADLYVKERQKIRHDRTRSTEERRRNNKSIYLFTTTPTSHTHTFHPLSTIVIHTLNFAQVKSMDDNCGEWVECMGVAYDGI